MKKILVVGGIPRNDHPAYPHSIIFTARGGLKQ
jgi:hypothetical protein